MFEEIGYYAQAGESYYQLGDFSKAARLYSEGKFVTKAVECYKKMRNWDAILYCIKIHEGEFTQEQKESLIYKYVPLALNSLYTIMTNDQLIEDGDRSDDEDVVRNEVVNTMRESNVI